MLLAGENGFAWMKLAKRYSTLAAMPFAAAAAAADLTRAPAVNGWGQVAVVADAGGALRHAATTEK